MLELLKAGWLAYVGLALLPTPPSPIPDFGTQFLFSLIIGVFVPERVLDLFSRFFFFLGRGSVAVFGKIPLVSKAVEKINNLYNRWVGWVMKERKSENRFLNKLYKMLSREDLIPRLVFGYFCSILIGLTLIAVSVLTLL